MENMDYEKMDNQKTEKIVLLLYIIYGCAMIAVSLVQNRASWVSLFLFANVVTGGILYFGHWRDYRSRAYAMTLMMGVMILLYGTSETDIYQMYAIVASFTVFAGFYGICDLIGIIWIVTAVLAFYHGAILKTMQFLPVEEGVRAILMTGNIFVMQFVVYRWVKQRNANDARAEKNIELLQQAERSKDDFLANVSHEIRTPINTICGMSEVVLGEDDPQKIKQQVRYIQYAGRNLMTMVSDILDFSELQAGTVELEEEAYHITSMINDVIQMGMAKIGNKPLELIVDCDPALPCGLYGDEKKIRRVIMNILENAIKFTNAGGAGIKITGRRETYGINLCITIWDTGIGMKEESLEKLFTSFAQVDTRRNRTEGGIGIGLAISQALVRKMGGVITVKSRSGKGTTVKVVIPQKVWDEQPIAEITDREKLNIAVYINMEQFAIDAVRDEYTDNIMHMVEQLKVCCRICRNLPELKRRQEREHFTHIFISGAEYREDREYFDSLADRTRVIAVIASNEEKDIANPRIGRILKPFYILPIISALNGGAEKTEAGYARHVRGFRAPTAHVLVADDNEMNIRVITALLEKYQIKVTEAGSGREALEKIESMNYDFVFMDHMMPGMDGVETLRLIRGKIENYYQKVPVIALTANAIAGMRERFLRNGFTDFLEKPVEASVLERVLRRNLPEEKIIPVGDDGENEEKASVQSLEQESVQEKKETNIVPEIEGVDKKTGLLYCGGEEGYRKVLEGYCVRGAEQLERIATLYQCEKWDEYVIAVHGIKSVMLSIGAVKVSELARAQEMAGKSGDFAYIKAHYDELADEYAHVLANIQKSMGIDAVPGEKDREREEEVLDMSALRALDAAQIEEYARRLEDLVYDMDSETMLAVIGELEQCSYCGKPLVKPLAKVRRKIEMADYMSALDTFEQICASIEAWGKGKENAQKA